MVKIEKYGKKDYGGITETPINELPWAKIIIYPVVGIIIIGLLMASFYTVGAGQRGVVLTWGEASQSASNPGLHFKVPVAQKVVKMDVQTQKYEVPASAASKDLQVVSSHVAVNYHLTPESVPSLYRDLGINYRDTVIAPAVQESVKAATAKYTAEELITKRDNVKEEIRAALTQRLISRGIQMEDVNIVNFDFSDSFNTAIEQKVTAEQLKLKAERDLERIQVEAMQIVATAQGQKDAQIAKAEGEARSIELIDQTLSKSPRYIEYLSTQKWDGKLPVYLTSGSPVPFVNVGGEVQ